MVSLGVYCEYALECYRGPRPSVVSVMGRSLHYLGSGPRQVPDNSKAFQRDSSKAMFQRHEGCSGWELLDELTTYT